MSKAPSIGVLIPTYQAARHLDKCLPPLLESSLRPRVLVIDSSSTDETAALARQHGAEVVVIPKAEFNHGKTREKGRHLLGTDIVVMVTQDAYAKPGMLEELVKPLVEGQAALSYARQLPHTGAGFFEAFPRRFNYPAVSQLRSLEDLDRYGVYTFFCSNSCAAYVNTALNEVGGFPDVLFGEDTVVTAKLLQRGHRIAYVAEAEVQHSHAYTLKQEFRRHFDIGLARKSYHEHIKAAGSDNKRGGAYVKAMLESLCMDAPFMIPYALLQTGAKFAGYRLGKASERAPLWVKRAFSSQPSYWK